MTDPLSRARPTLALTLLAAAAAAQCPNPSTGISAGPLPSPGGPIYAMVRWDPDGSGPLGEHVVCGGAFGHAGAVAAANVALYDPIARVWSSLGAGFDGPVQALHVQANGILVAGGEFTTSGSAPVASIAQWTGAGWSAVGGGVQGFVSALANMPNGDLIAGGTFASAGGVAANHIARWDGAAWNALGTGVAGTPTVPLPPSWTTQVWSLGVRGNGDLMVGGLFTSAGGVAVNGLARWNGGTWSGVGFPISSSYVSTLVVLANGDVVVASTAPGVSINRWNGVSWAPMTAGVQTVPVVLRELASGTLLAVADATSGVGFELLQWNGASWQPWPTQPPGNLATALLELGNGDLLLGGYADRAGACTLRRWDGTAWRAPAAGFDGRVRDVLALPDGSVVIGGDFEQVGGAPARHIAVQQGGAYTELGGGVAGTVTALARAANGDLLVAGDFLMAGNVPVDRLARWDGAQWHAFGPLPAGDGVMAVLPLANGDVLVGGAFPGLAARWNGSQWQNLAVPGFNWVSALAELPNGDLVAGHYNFANPPTLVQRWNGSSWAPLGSGIPIVDWSDGVSALCVLPGGELVAAGSFTLNLGATTTRNIAVWNGTTWDGLAGGLPSEAFDLALLPNGDLVAAHYHLDGFAQPVVSPSRWNGALWTPIAGITGSGQAVAAGTDGLLWVGGAVTAVQGVASGSIASLATGCPAFVTPAGAGCVGSAGPVVTTIEVRAWLGATCLARTNGLPASSLAVQVLGLGSVVAPLATVFAQALPGCTLHVSPDVLGLALPSGGVATTTVPIPNAPVLLGQSFRQQLVVFEWAPTGAITAVSSANAELLTIGSW